MNFGLDLDVLKLWDRYSQSRGTEVKHFANQPSPPSGRPCPHLQTVRYLKRPTLCEPFPIIIAAENAGSAAFAGGITVSFRDVGRNADGLQVNAVSDAGPVLMYQAGDMLHSSDEGNWGDFVASDLVRQIEIMPWHAKQRIELRMTVNALRPGVFQFFVTAWASMPNWSHIIRTPTSRDVVDQQNHGVFAFAMNVLPGT